MGSKYASLSDKAEYQHFKTRILFLIREYDGLGEFRYIREVAVLSNSIHTEIESYFNMLMAYENIFFTDFYVLLSEHELLVSMYHRIKESQYNQKE